MIFDNTVDKWITFFKHTTWNWIIINNNNFKKQKEF